ncbi:3'-5' exonuclease [Microbispora bryophytorum]|uniref:3'-5' exonuclease n=1 Tax=Microbispora bryophytorum TaxID=1460882 RepID=UPI0033C434AE
MAPLRPRGKQSQVIYLPPTGHSVVLGTAGTGKTVMAMLRARYLSDPSTRGYGRVLLVTYNNALVAYIKHQQGSEFSRVQVETYSRFARGYLHSRGLMPRWGGITEGPHQRSLVEQALAAIAKQYPPSRFFERDIDFFQDEIAWISGMGISDLSSYLKMDRIGRGTGLTDNHRIAVWQIREDYLRRRKQAGYLYDWHDVASTVRQQLAVDDRPRIYKHIVIDEGQDLTPEMIRSLVEAVDPSGSVTFFGDYAQQIYGQGLSWRACNLRITKEERFADNYRNTAAIARLAIEMSKMPHFGGSLEDLVEPVAPTAEGTPPTIVQCRSAAEELQIVRTRAAALSQVNSVAVLARTWADANLAVQGLRGARRLKADLRKWDESPGIFYGPYHSAKGLEFDVVLMPFCGAKNAPHPDVVAAFGRTNAMSREAKLLYVGVTRARSELILTYNAEKDTLTPLLPTTDDLYVVVSP